MADACIFYSGDEKLPQRLEDALSPPWTIWWDKQVISDFTAEIQTEIQLCQCVIPIWSENFEKSAYAKDEVNYAIAHGKHVLPVKFKATDRAPLGFGNFDIIDLSDWDGRKDHPGIENLFRKLKTVIGLNRPVESYSIKETKNKINHFKRPTFYYSVSSFDTRIEVTDAISRLNIFQADNILISAYDMHKVEKENLDALQSNLSAIQERGATVMLDSGQYEATRKQDEEWNVGLFKKTLESAQYDYAFCFDNLKIEKSPQERINQIVEAYNRDKEWTNKPVIPIIHTTNDDEGVYEFKNLTNITFEVAQKLRPNILAIPERELGMGVIQRAKAIHDIRKELNQLDYYQPIHILGTGNPVSMALFTVAGADSFDGLEWCRFAIDAKFGRIHHMHNFDIIKNLSQNMRDDLCRKMCFDESLDYIDRVLFNNYGVLSEFIDDLHSGISSDNYDIILKHYVPEGPLNEFKRILKVKSE